ncbi:zinc finger domain-containing protein [Mycobacterium kansasii]
MTLSAALTNPDSPTVINALTHTCPLCHALKNQLCHNICTNGPLPGRLIHHARIEAQQ